MELFVIDMLSPRQISSLLTEKEAWPNNSPETGNSSKSQHDLISFINIQLLSNNLRAFYQARFVGSNLNDTICHIDRHGHKTKVRICPVKKIVKHGTITSGCLKLALCSL